MKKMISKSLKRTLIAFEITLFLLILLLLFNFYFPLGKGREYVYFSERNLSTLTTELKHYGYNIIETDQYLLSLFTLPERGWYKLNHRHEGRYSFFKHLKDSPAETIKIKIYAGETHYDIIKRLAKDLHLDEKKLSEIYNHKRHFKEGDIFSGTYTIAKYADENSTLQFLFDRSGETLNSFTAQYFSKPIDKDTLKLLITIASIIQKETNNPKEMTLISSVIYNRLDKGMKLQMDGTLNYGKYSHCIVTPERIKSDNTYYNTYKYKGLPPAPLSSISIEALKAAMFPAQTNYLFFMLNKEGGHTFSTTYQDHLAALKKFRMYQQKKMEEMKGKENINKQQTACSL